MANKVDEKRELRQIIEKQKRRIEELEKEVKYLRDRLDRLPNVVS